jgi:uncharacterized protein (DUF1919 family)
MNLIVISNTCVGYFIMKKKEIFPYNNPFIGSIIPNDLDYLKLIYNFDKYIQMSPILGLPSENSLFANQNKNKYYLHEQIKIPYPIIYLGDIEIHFIHENNENICIETFNRRLNRMKEIITNHNYKIIFTLSFSELINDHDDIAKIINNYFNNDNNQLINEKYFIGPPEFNNGNSKYINVDKWSNCSLTRNSSHVYDINDQPFSINIFCKYI